MIWKEDHRKNLAAALKDLDAFFLITVGAGIFTAVVSLASRMPYMIATYTEFMFACFMGLIIPSISIPWKMIKEKHAIQYVALLGGLVFTVGISP